MTRNQRQKAKLKYRRQLWLALAMIGLFVLNLVLLITIDWRPEAMSDPTETTDLLLAMFVCIVLFVPLMLGLTFNVRATWTHRGMYDERRRLYKEKERHYVDMFMMAVKEERYPDARAIHDDLLWDNMKRICRGILLGIYHIRGSEDEKALALRHFNEDIPDEAYTPAKE